MPSVPDILEPLFRGYDVCYSQGAIDFHATRNLLVELTDTLDHCSGCPLLKMTAFQPSGFGYHERLKGHLTVPLEEPAEETMLLWNCSKPEPPKGLQIWLLDVLECDFIDATLQLGYEFVESSHWMIAPKPDFDGVFRVCEMFAGSFAGWKQALNFMQQTCPISVQTVALEHDPEIAAGYALSHEANFVAAPSKLSPFTFVHSSVDWVVCTDVGNQIVLDAIAHWQPQIMTMSPPCQPWSQVGTEQGLFRSDGLLLADTLLKTRFLRVPMLLLEEVVGFPKHPHFQAIQDILHWIGYRCVWNKVMNLHDVTRVNRPRWLALYTRFGVELPATIHQVWTRVDRTLLLSPVMFLPSSDLAQLRLCDKALALASDPQFLKTGGKRFPSTMTEDTALSMRTYPGFGEIPCFLAMYGKQHELHEELLQQKGYQAHFVKDTKVPETRRYWHPAEVALAHGIAQPIYLPQPHNKAWAGLGNMISVQHALVLLCNAMRKYEPELPNTNELLSNFRHQQLQSTNIEMYPIAQGFLLGPENMTIPLDFQMAASQIHLSITATNPEQFWHPKHGLSVWSDMQPCQPDAIISLLTPDALDETQLDLENDHPVVKGCVCFDTHQSTFWFSGDLPASTLESIWDNHFSARYSGLDSEIQVEMRRQAIQVHTDAPRDCVLVMDQQALTLMQCPFEDISVNPQLKHFAENLFDQYGPLTQGQKPSAMTCVFSAPLEFSPKTLPSDVPQILHSLTQIGMKWTWDPKTDLLTCHLQGPVEFVTGLGNFWTQVYTNEHQAVLGRKLTHDATWSMVSFEPIHSQGVCPATVFRSVISIHMTRTCMNFLQTQKLPNEALLQMILKWKGRPLWKGGLPTDLTVQVLQSLLHRTMSALTGTQVFLKRFGQKLGTSQTIRDIPRDSDRELILLHVEPSQVVNLVGGGTGTGSKQQQRQAHQSALATALLEHGYPLSTVTKAVDGIVGVSLCRNCNRSAINQWEPRRSKQFAKPALTCALICQSWTNHRHRSNSHRHHGTPRRQRQLPLIPRSLLWLKITSKIKIRHPRSRLLQFVHNPQGSASEQLSRLQHG